MPDGYYIKRRDQFLGKELRFGESGSNTFLRLAKKGAGTWKRPVHEVWNIDGKTEELTHPIEHRAADSLSDFVRRINDYSTINAEYLYKKKVRVHWWDIILYPKGKFLMNYFWKQGFRDGLHGFVHAMLMSFHSFLTRGKLYLLWHKKPVA